MRIVPRVKVVNVHRMCGQRGCIQKGYRPGTEAEGFRGQLGAKWSELLQVKQACLILTDGFVCSKLELKL